MLNLFQHLTASLTFPILGEILKQVQDDETFTVFQTLFYVDTIKPEA